MKNQNCKAYILVGSEATGLYVTLHLNQHINVQERQISYFFLTLNNSINFYYFFLNSGPLGDKFGSEYPFEAVLFIKLTTVNLHIEQLSVKKKVKTALQILAYLSPEDCTTYSLITYNFAPIPTFCPQIIYLLCSTYTHCPRLLSFSKLSILPFYSL